MRRFYCQKCQKIKHVRVMPSSVKTPLAENPRDRVGECRWHDPNFQPERPTAKPKVYPAKKAPQPEVAAVPKKGGKR